MLALINLSKWGRQFTGQVRLAWPKCPAISRSLSQNRLHGDENFVQFTISTESRSSVASRGYLISDSLIQRPPCRDGKEALLDHDGTGLRGSNGRGSAQLDA